MSNIFTFDEFELDCHKGELRRAGIRMRADGLVLRLLEVLVRKQGELVTKQELALRVWNSHTISHNAISVAIARLRRLLGDERGTRDMVLTVHGRGYRFSCAVEALAPHPQPFVSVGAARVPPPFVGRERVLEHLGLALSEAGSGSGGLLVLTGEPGIGKTRVADVMAREARSAGVPVAWGYCRELGSTPPLWPVAGVLRHLIGQSLAARIVLRDPRFVASVPELLHLLPELATNPKAKPEADAIENVIDLGSKYRIFDAVTHALTRAAEHSPYILMLDDLHHADTLSLELLYYLLPELSRTRILFLATLGDEGEAAANQPLTQILCHRNCTRISLQRLSEADVARYVVALSGDADSAQCRAIFEKSEGNPLLMAELARHMFHHGQSQVAWLEIPSAALQQVRQRVAKVDATTREVLSQAALIGRNFSLSRLLTISNRDAPALMTSLDAAIASDLIRPSRDSTTEFVFTHALTREALNEALAPTERRSCAALDEVRRSAKH